MTATSTHVTEAIELEGKTLGLVGFGRIARRVAAFAQSLGMKVVAFDPFLGGEDLRSRWSTTSENCLARADVVSVHVPLTRETKRSVRSTPFEAMKPGSFLINTSRGSVVDQGALWRRSTAGICRGQALDVTDPEPLPPDHPLLHRSDVRGDPARGLCHHRGEAQDFAFGPGRRCWPSWTGRSRST